MLKNNDNTLAFKHVSVRRGERAELISDTMHPLSFPSSTWNYKPVRVRTSSHSNSKDKCWERGDPTAGEHFPSHATLPTQIPQGRGSQDQVIVIFPQIHPLKTQTKVSTAVANKENQWILSPSRVQFVTSVVRASIAPPTILVKAGRGRRVCVYKNRRRCATSHCCRKIYSLPLCTLNEDTGHDPNVANDGGYERAPILNSAEIRLIWSNPQLSGSDFQRNQSVSTYFEMRLKTFVVKLSDIMF